jgi:hypothetical protein
LDICKVKPSAVAVEAPKVGTLALPFSEAIAEDVAVPVSKLVRVVRIVTVEEVPGFIPVTVINPLLPIATEPPSEFVPDQLNEGSQFPI